MADTTPTLREAAQQALEALTPLANATTPAEREALTDADAQAADAASCDLRAALAEQAAEQAVIPPAFAHAASQQMAVTSEWCRGWDDCRAHILSTAPAAEQAEPVAVPAGYALVPVEPTEAMLAAAHEGDRQYTLRNFGDVMTVMQGPYDHWHAMIAAAPPAPARQEWQPIETAPTDTEVLIGAWIDGEFKWGRSVRFYDSGNEREGEPACGWVWSIDDCSDSVAENPTHWQPLPAAPITAAQAEGGA